MIVQPMVQQYLAPLVRALVVWTRRTRARVRVRSVDAEDTGARSCSVRKRVAIAAGSVAVLAIGGCCTAWAAGLFNTEDATPVEVTVTNTDEDNDDEDVIVDGVATVQLIPTADGFDENSSPFIAHIVGETATGEKVDYYHAVWGDGSTSEVELEQGEYEITWISAINSDGSIYSTNDIITTLTINADDIEAANAAVGVGVETTDDNKDTGNEDASESITVAAAIGVDQEFELIDADDVTEEDIEAIMTAIEDAIANGDETLTNTNGTTIVEIVEENTATADDTTAESTSDVTTEEISGSSSSENSSNSSSTNSSKSSDSNSTSSSSSSNNSSTSSSSGSSSSSSSSSSSNNSSKSSTSSSSSKGSASNSSSSNNSTNSSSNSSNSSNSSSSTHTHSWTAVSTCWECKGCGEQFSEKTEVFNHIKSTSCGSYCVKYNYTCSCGASKVDW